MSWQQLYQKALDEHDTGKLRELIADTECAMVRRMEGLGSSDDRERNLIRDACNRLLVVKTERFKWPRLDYAVKQSQTSESDRA
jgi:hypothetical protein